MKIVITGGAGFIGSNFIKYILNKYPDYKILNIDKLTYAGNLENLKEVERNKNYEFLKKDICDKDLKDFINGYDVVINFAAESHVDRAIYEPYEFLKTDIFGTFNLLEICKKKGMRFIQISTDEVYGSIEDGSFDENSPLNPSNPYSSSKASADLITISYFKTYKLPINIIRSCNNYGPNQYPEKFIPLMITNAIEDKKLPIYGDGLYKREWIYVIDNCMAIDIVLHKGKEGEIYNISSEFSIPNIEIAKKILKILGKSESLIEFVKDRPGHDRRYSIKCEKIKELGWKLETDFENGIKLTIKWYKENEKWWKKIKSSNSFISHLEKTYTS
ncbi:MAG: dTDP-glucose 4,6-dehydratase [Candidatus Ratteibacteria bacterium]